MLEELGRVWRDDHEKGCLSDQLKERPAIKYWMPTDLRNGTWVFWDDPILLPPGCDPGIPTTNPGITHKVLSALRSSSLRMRYTADGPVMVQFWAPVTIGGRRLLATSDQPFGLSHLREGFCAYRKECVGLKLCVEAEEAGVLGGVFRNKCIASTPDVAYYSVAEYPQRELALKCNVMGHFALPLFESSTQNCAGVLEFIKYGHKGFSINFGLIEIRHHLQELNLKLGVSDSRQRYWAKEHSKMRDMMSEVHKLGYGLAWVACRDCNMSVEPHATALEKSCFGFDQICLVGASYSFEVDPFHCFVNICRQQPLQKGQGLVGKAYLSRKPYFCRDITKFTSNQYPLVHHARHAGLAQNFAICLHDSYTDNDYILELFFKPGECEDPQVFLGSLMTILEKFPTFTVASREESSGEELCVEIVQFGMQRSQTVDSAPRPGTSQDGDGDGDGGDNLLVSSSDQQAVVEVEDDAGSGDGAVVVDDVKGSDPAPSYPQHTNTGFSITCETLEQHFGRKPEDAAESIGVSHSKLKRICRPRWPPCKRNKANHSPPNGHRPIRLLPQQPVATMDTAVQDASIITIKAKYQKKFIKFELPISSGMAELVQQLSKMLKLSVATYNISYLDEEGDSILIACDEDLQSYMNSCRSLGVATIKIAVPGNNLSPSK